MSGVGRELAVPGMRGVPIKNVIQTDAAINPGQPGFFKTNRLNAKIVSMRYCSCVLLEDEVAEGCP